MMESVYVRRKYECPFCQGQFERVQLKESAPPSYCDLCGERVDGQVDGGTPLRKVAKDKVTDRPRRPRDRRVSRGTISKSVDMVYRGMENASNDRMQEAASLLGCDPSSLSAMKMTDMKDNMREGDLSGQSYTPAKAAADLVGTAPVFALPGAPRGMNAFQGGTEGSEYAKTVGAGPEPFAGNRIREMVTSNHGVTAQRVTRAGRINKA